MATKINISIPQPCHENWEAMTAVDKGKFCASCQKNVFDFTSATDREIINAFERDNHLCGRFLNTQLNRDLIKPKEKSSLWLATTTALISLFGINEVAAQGKAKIEQTDKKILKEPLKTNNDTILVSGIVYDENKTPMPNLGIYIRDYKVGETDGNGNFSIYTHLGARIVFRNADEDNDDANEYYVRNNHCSNIEIDYVKYHRVTKQYITAGGISGMKVSYRRSFFGRLFHKNKYK